MKPIRKKEFYEVTNDAATGRERILGASYEEHILSDEGSIDTLGKKKVYFTDCGCNRPPGGRCHVCGKISCVSCHGRCQLCSVPLCQACSIFVTTQGGGQLRFCRQCYDTTRRRRRLVAFARVVLSPFLRFEDEDGKR